MKKKIYPSVFTLPRLTTYTYDMHALMQERKPCAFPYAYSKTKCPSSKSVLKIKANFIFCLMKNILGSLQISDSQIPTPSPPPYSQKMSFLKICFKTFLRRFYAIFSYKKNKIRMFFRISDSQIHTP